MTRNVGRIDIFRRKLIYGVVAPFARLFVPQLQAQNSCEYIRGKWRCQKCGWLNAANAMYCLRDHANLEDQRRTFRRDLQQQFAITPLRVVRGEAVVLSWYTNCATRASIEPSIGEVTAAGSLSLVPTETTEYQLVTESSWATWIDAPMNIKVEVLPPAVRAELRVRPTTIWAGDSISVSWQTSNTSRLTLNPGSKVVAPIGEIDLIDITRSTTIQLVAEGESGDSETLEQTVTVRSLPSSPAVPPQPNYSEMFERSAPKIYFPDKEPDPARRLPFTLSVDSRQTLDRFAEFLLRYPEIRLKVIGSAFEGVPFGNNKGDADLNRFLMTERRDHVYRYLVSKGVESERIIASEDQTLRPIPPASVRGNPQKEKEGRATFFEYAGSPPTLIAEAYPSEVSNEEDIFLLWNAENASEVSIQPNIGVVPVKGTVRLRPPRTMNYIVTARNDYGLFVSRSVAVQVNPVQVKPFPPKVESKRPFKTEVSDIFFEKGSAVLNAVSRKLLDRAAIWLLEPDNRRITIVLRGFSDGNELGTLAAQRAQTSRDFLVKAGIPQTRVSMINSAQPPSFPEFDRNRNIAAWRALNRRVQISQGAN